MIHRFVMFLITCNGEGCVEVAATHISEAAAVWWAKNEGWQECMNGKWLCPNCAKQPQHGSDDGNGR